MFNRHTYEKYESLLLKELRKEEELKKIMDKRRSKPVVSSEERVDKTEMYKERVRDFLVKMASKPLELGQYIPPINHIVRINDETKNLANAQLYINGFKTNKERLEVTLSSFSGQSARIKSSIILQSPSPHSTTSLGPDSHRRKSSQA